MHFNFSKIDCTVLDLKSIAQVNKIINNYFKILRLEKKHGK
jgi:hypothetical protein